MKYTYGSRIECKPILHPLSDLTKEIEHNGEKFVPIKMFARMDQEAIKESTPLSRVKGAEFLSFYIFRQLVEWHFDVAYLIGKCEAIDVNSLEINPYK